MGAVRMRVQIADKNITIIHTTPIYQLTTCKSKNMFVKKEKKGFVLLVLKYESSIQIIAF